MELQVLPEFKDTLYSNIELGIKLAKQTNICITGLCRDVSDRLPNCLKALDRIGSYFKNCNYFIYENDSKDNTPEILKEWSNSTNKKYISENLNSTHPIGNTSKDKSRTEALATYRNLSQSYIKNTFDSIDYILVIDLDFITFAPTGILNSLGWMNQLNFGAMAGHSFSIYNPSDNSKKTRLLNYDSWAFRHNWWSDYQPYLMQWFVVWEPFVGSPPIQVNSAFGGSCLYKTDYYLSDCQYEGYDCEHVCFHKNLYNKFSDFKLGLNPSQIMIL